MYGASVMWLSKGNAAVQLSYIRNATQVLSVQCAPVMWLSRSTSRTSRNFQGVPHGITGVVAAATSNAQ